MKRRRPTVACDGDGCIRTHVKKLACILFGGCVFFTGCQAAYQVVSAPVGFIHRQIDKSPTTVTSDVTTPGRPVAPGTSSNKKHESQANAPRPSPTPASTSTRKLTAQAKATPSPKASTAQLSFPTAKSVPGKPGYVFSVSDPGKYVDVSGYAPGSKVKDPYSGKIFLVP
jgi:hypothetical protein